jgi:hypothetical protein
MIKHSVRWVPEYKMIFRNPSLAHIKVQGRVLSMRASDWHENTHWVLMTFYHIFRFQGSIFRRVIPPGASIIFLNFFSILLVYFIQFMPSIFRFHYALHRIILWQHVEVAFGSKIDLTEEWRARRRKITVKNKTLLPGVKGSLRSEPSIGMISWKGSVSRHEEYWISDQGFLDLNHHVVR